VNVDAIEHVDHPFIHPHPAFCHCHSITENLWFTGTTANQPRSDIHTTFPSFICAASFTSKVRCTIDIFLVLERLGPPPWFVVTGELTETPADEWEIWRSGTTERAQQSEGGVKLAFDV